MSSGKGGKGTSLAVGEGGGVYRQREQGRRGAVGRQVGRVVGIGVSTIAEEVACLPA